MPAFIEGAKPNFRVAMLGMLVQLALAAVTVPSLGVNVMSFTPFLAAIWLWSLPLRWALVSGVLWWGISVGVIVLVVGRLEPSYILGPSIALLFVCFFRFFNELAAREESVATELATVREREEISRDVHDLLGHSLTVVVLKAQLARKLLRDDPDRAEAELDELLRLTHDSLGEVRGVVGRMRTPDLASQVEAARTALTAADVQLHLKGSPHHVPTSRRALFAWAIREGVTNVVRHAGAEAVTISLAAERLEIADDGRGLTGDEGHGLTGLRHRIEDAGATLRILPLNRVGDRPGTRLIVEYPA
jgi:two-component system sensor histidine kinase DesK